MTDDDIVPAEVDLDDDGYDEDEGPDEGIIRAKWIMDGATTLSEAADQVQAFAAYLRALERAGAQLTQPIEDDYGFYLPADAAPLADG